MGSKGYTREVRVTDSPRKQSLRASLLEDLGAIPRSDSAGELDHLVWLLEQVENYVRRWIGFGTSEAAPTPTGALWDMVEIGTDVLAHELTSTNTAVDLLELLGRLQAGVASVGAAEDGCEPTELREIVSAMQDCIAG